MVKKGSGMQKTYYLERDLKLNLRTFHINPIGLHLICSQANMSVSWIQVVYT